MLRINDVIQKRSSQFSEMLPNTTTWRHLVHTYVYTCTHPTLRIITIITRILTITTTLHSRHYHGNQCVVQKNSCTCEFANNYVYVHCFVCVHVCTYGWMDAQHNKDHTPNFCTCETSENTVVQYSFLETTTVAAVYAHTHMLHKISLELEPLELHMFVLWRGERRPSGRM